MDLAARTDDLFAKFATQDADGVAALCAAGCRVRRNNDPESDIETLLVELRAMFWDTGVQTAYSDVRRTVADHAVTEQHVVTLTRPDGVAASCDVCVVIRFNDDGLITKLDEYLDTVAFAPLLS
jgi:ketosteroid isomerase-like protein